MSERLNKVLAAHGIASRRGADLLITEGVVEVNGEVITHLGTQVEPTDKIRVKGKDLVKPDFITYAFYKPRGVITSLEKQGEAPIVSSYIPEKPVVHPVGRLDKESDGLLLLTNDGELTNRLTHPKFEHEKEYRVVCTSAEPIDAAALKARLLSGVKLGDGKAKADAVSVQSQENGTIVLVITVHEGRHHLIRRMCATVNLDVQNLTRTRISKLHLGSLKPGEYRKLSDTDLTLLT